MMSGFAVGRKLNHQERNADEQKNVGETALVQDNF